VIGAIAANFHQDQGGQEIEERAVSVECVEVPGGRCVWEPGTGFDIGSRFPEDLDLRRWHFARCCFDLREEDLELGQGHRTDARRSRVDCPRGCLHPVG
jgi:hypothetical protein